MPDIACTHAAGCDLVIAEYTSRSSVATDDPMEDAMELAGVINALTTIDLRSREQFPRGPEADGLLALMDYQAARLMRELPVRMLCLLHAITGASKLS